MKFITILILGILYADLIKAEPVAISLEEYTFDFATIGYNIQVNGKIRNGFEPLEGSDYTTLYNNGYSIRVRVSTLSRKGKRDLTKVFNMNCIGYSDETNCIATIAGEVQLDEDMRINLYARKVTLFGMTYE